MTLRIVLSGSRAFGAAVADAIKREGDDIALVVSPAFAPPYSHLHNTYGSPEEGFRHDRLRSWAETNGIPWLDAIELRADRIPESTDVIVAAHSHAFISRKTRHRARYAIGYHPSLLPVHRGRDAIRWTIRDRDKITGGSVYHLTDNVDAGPIVIQDWCHVRPDDTPESLWHEALFPMGVRLITESLLILDVTGELPYRPQDEALATWEPSWQRPPLHRPELPELPSHA